MLSLADFLTNAPKTYVIRLHRRQHPGEGLLQANRVTQLVFDWAVEAGFKRVSNEWRVAWDMTPKEGDIVIKRVKKKEPAEPVEAT